MGVFTAKIPMIPVELGSVRIHQETLGEFIGSFEHSSPESDQSLVEFSANPRLFLWP
jgi:hypothetical protein